VLRLLNNGLLPDGYRIEDVDSDGIWLRRQGVRGPEVPGQRSNRISVERE
jgi:hypothetical protein